MSEVLRKSQPEDVRPQCHLKLFVADGEPNSIIAQRNLKKLQSSRFQCELVVEVIDVLDDYQAALDARILVTPCLVLFSPPPRVVVVGTLKDRDKVIAALRLVEQECSDGE